MSKIRMVCKSRVMKDILAEIDRVEDEGFEVIEILVDRPSMREIVAECMRMNGGVMDRMLGSMLYGCPMAEAPSLNGFELVKRKKPEGV